VRAFLNPVRKRSNLTVLTQAQAERIVFSGKRATGLELHLKSEPVQVDAVGGGAIGLACALVARLFGASEIIVAETNPLRRRTLEAEPGIGVYAPGGAAEPAESSIDLVLDAVGADATRAAACRIVRPGGVIVHIGLLPGTEGLDIRKITLQEITLSGSYCYTPTDFGDTVGALVAGHLGTLAWTEERALSEGDDAFRALDSGATAAAKIVLRA
jgi:threonine dehydrogenase-like Zn-dependent dehydrogenase